MTWPHVKEEVQTHTDVLGEKSWEKAKNHGNLDALWMFLGGDVFQWSSEEFT